MTVPTTALALRKNQQLGPQDDDGSFPHDFVSLLLLTLESTDPNESLPVKRACSLPERASRSLPGPAGPPGTPGSMRRYFKEALELECRQHCLKKTPLEL